MKRILIIVSIILISLFTVSCKYKYKEEPIPNKENLGERFPIVHANCTPTKRRYFYDETITLNFYAVQGHFNNDGSSDWYNYHPAHRYSSPLFSKIEIRIVINPSYDTTTSNYIYLTDYIDLTFNHGFNEEEGIIDDGYPHYHLDGTTHSFLPDLSVSIPIKVSFDPNLVEKGEINYIFYEARYTVSEEYVNAGYMDDGLSYLSSNNTDTLVYIQDVMLLFFSLDDFIYFQLLNDPNMKTFYDKTTQESRYIYEPLNQIKQMEYKRRHFELNRDLPHNW